MTKRPNTLLFVSFTLFALVGLAGLIVSISAHQTGTSIIFLGMVAVGAVGASLEISRRLKPRPQRG